MYALRVYPRVGGETRTGLMIPSSTRGLSPRGRGNPPYLIAALALVGSIPAWAGKPHVLGVVGRGQRVYPRVGGETRPSVLLRCRCGGLSPRGRGNRLMPLATASCLRSIPAWAGKPSRLRRESRGPRVYPRVGGETIAGPARFPNALGLSPRGRGNLWAPETLPCGYGSIPAWAGKPRKRTAKSSCYWVYPRVGGETEVSIETRHAINGLSPRGRGNLGWGGLGDGGCGSIPAWAGKPDRRPLSTRPLGVYPRVGGETARRTKRWRTDGGLSPRGRGNRQGDQCALNRSGSIPAWAGKPLCHNDPVSQENEYVKDRWTYGDSPAIRRIRRHTSCASGSARWRGAAVKIDSTSQAVASEV